MLFFACFACSMLFFECYACSILLFACYACSMLFFACYACSMLFFEGYACSILFFACYACSMLFFACYAYSMLFFACYACSTTKEAERKVELCTLLNIFLSIFVCLLNSHFTFCTQLTPHTRSVTPGQSHQVSQFSSSQLMRRIKMTIVVVTITTCTDLFAVRGLRERMIMILA